MNNMDDCLFCQIAAKKVKSFIVYEDEKTVAFLDINPVHSGHALVISKNHSTELTNASDQDLADMIKTAKIIGRALMIALEVSGFNIQINTGKVSGQVISHTHFHIIPRYPDDGLRLWPQSQYKTDQEASEIASKIKNSINENN